VRALEEAFLLDTSRDDVRHELTSVMYERIQLAEREYRTVERDELLQRVALYDPVKPARLDVTSDAGATVRVLDATGTAPVTYLPGGELAPGSYVVEASAVGHTPVRIPIALRPGEQRAVDVRLPAMLVAGDYVYIPAGKFLFGSNEEERIREWLATTPMHEVETGAYLVGRTEVTYAQWIEFLDAIDPAARARHTPRVETAAQYRSGALELRTLADGRRELAIMPETVLFTAREGEAIVYAERTRRQRHDWRRLPVSAISPEDAEAYAAWLRDSGRLPRARLCTEHEWERAARGVDGRRYPHGDRLEPDDANIDTTYDRRQGAYGPDEVGSHPRSTSPYGLVDASGNVWEITRGVGGAGYVSKGGTFYQSFRAAHLANRDIITKTYRHVQVGLRMCADVP
jgi:formylglycine-generating enzyme required for sulfatase activity